MFFIACIVCAVIAAVLAALFWPETKEILSWLISLTSAFAELVKQIGLGWFVAAYALLPAIGVPISIFNLAINPVFGTKIGLTWVIVLAALCLMCANAFSYWLARYALRPLIEKLIKALGYSLPVIPPDEHVTACILLRVLPGAPYVLQSYILGLAKVRFVPYMIVSFVGQFGWALAMIIFGETFKQGASFKIIFSVVLIVVLLVLGTRWVRKYYSKKTSFKGITKTDGDNA